MDDIDRLLGDMAMVSASRSWGSDPSFVARLDASATRGELLGTVRAVVIGVVVAGLMVAIHPVPLATSHGPLLTTADGEVL